ncbi:hypothetical protein Psesu_0463 [Pseudoxanthomonas suwonensis 11-1]|uniref:Uncharacterized protein n=1 Tax=Pseudoxanthomonas suwonensis (strain 11-1) TaxID=743721 RepID=E6WQ72_PSEUU|nr:hypothetical protein [Pseudoxanthomonas suwonensis]ADV26321.1 hypothetical protein Psesu_0463 [Pseudoxanthomonas suwonensis 11-1]
MAREHGGKGISLATGIALGIALSLATSGRRSRPGDDAEAGDNRDDGKS